MDSTYVVLLLLVGWLAWSIYRRSSRGQRRSVPDQRPRQSKGTYTLKAKPAELIQMSEPTDRLFTYQDERKAHKARQALWIRYQDKVGNITERIVEIYHPENDEVLFTWCRMKQEPRTFARRNIHSWRLLQERFEFDPIVARFWKEEGTLGLGDGIPWRRWLQDQPDDVARKYS